MEVFKQTETSALRVQLYNDNLCYSANFLESTGFLYLLYSALTLQVLKVTITWLQQFSMCQYFSSLEDIQQPCKADTHGLLATVPVCGRHRTRQDSASFLAFQFQCKSWYFSK